MLFFVQNGWLHCNLEWRDSFSTSRALRNMFQSRLTQETTHTLCLYSHSVNTIGDTSSVAATCCIGRFEQQRWHHTVTPIYAHVMLQQVTAVFSWTIGVATQLKPPYQRWYRRRGGQTRVKEIAEFWGGFSKQLQQLLYHLWAFLLLYH